jgi:phosphate transport system permease protein
LPASDTIVLPARETASTTPTLHGTTGLGERLVEFLLAGCGVVTVFTTLGILMVLAVETFAFVRTIGIAPLIFDTQWTPLFADKHFGIWPLLGGTFLTSLVAIAVALPLGLLAAIFMSEIASERWRKILKPALEVLAGVPTIVYGYFALIVVTPLLQRMIPELGGFNALGAGLVMGIMIMPLIASLTEDALYAVPRSLREASYALGASRVPTILRVVVPAAMGGISASVILALSRAVGETMIVAIAAGQEPRLTLDPRMPIQTMTAYIVQISMGDTPAGTIEYRTIFVVGTLLFLITFVMNVFAFRLARRFRGST